MVEKKRGKVGVKNSQNKLSIDDLAAFCKRKGFVYPSAEIYGGLAGFWDYGHLGVELVNNLKKEWWKFHVHQKDDMVGIDGSIITNPKVWEASGHVKNFIEYIVRDKKKGKVFKVDVHEVEEYKKSDRYVVEGTFNPMFTTNVGPVVTEGSTAYLRPETAQLIFTNFKFVQDNSRMSLPFGIAQIGKAFRNEISPREFLFRKREFEQMEIEYFIERGTKCHYIDEIRGIELEIFSENDQKKKKKGKKIEIYDAFKKGIIKTDWHAYWIAEEFRWFVMMGANPDNFRVRQHTSEERAHYAIDTWDLEYNFPMGWRELQGFANRGNFDLSQHEKYSKKSMSIQGSKGKVIPDVICEPSLGVERAILVFLFDAYEYDKKRDNVVLHLSPKLASYKAAIFPLISKGEMLEAAKEIHKDLLEEFNVLFDKSGSIGRRYARNDEIGTPFCITIDGDTLNEKTVTIRDRDTTKQIRVDIKELRNVLRKLVNDDISFEAAGRVVK